MSAKPEALPTLSPSSLSVVRALVALMGLGLIAYALSDDPFYGGQPGFGAVQGALTAIGLGLVAVAALAPRWSPNVLLLGVVSGMTLATLETVAEWLLGATFRPPFQYDERLLFELRPGAVGVSPQLPENGGGVVTHRINADGLRGPEVERPKKRPRVVVYGDSFVHAGYTVEEETFVRRLEARLSERLGGVEVLNAGVSSYGPDQVLLRLETELDTLTPDLVVLALFAGNDYGDLLRNKIFRIGPDGSLEANPHHVDPEIVTSLRLNVEKSLLMRVFGQVKGMLTGTKAPPLDTSPEGRRAQVQSWLDEAAAEYRELVLEKDPVVRNTHVDHYSADLSVDPALPSSRYEAQLMSLVLEAIRQRLEARSIPFFLVVIPHPMDVGEGYEYSEVDRARFPAYDRRNLVAPLEAWARTSSVPVISVFDVFTAHGAPRSLYLRGGDDHWNAEGQRLAAEAVAARILEAGALRRGDASHN